MHDLAAFAAWQTKDAMDLSGVVRKTNAVRFLVNSAQTPHEDLAFAT
jgi:hypothetical protein